MRRRTLVLMSTPVLMFAHGVAVGNGGPWWLIVPAGPLMLLHSVAIEGIDK